VNLSTRNNQENHQRSEQHFHHHHNTMMEMTDLPLDDDASHDNEQVQERMDSQQQQLHPQFSTTEASAPSLDEGTSWSDGEEEMEGRRSLLESQPNETSSSQSFDIETLRNEYRTESSRRKRQRQSEDSSSALGTIGRWHWLGGNDENDNHNEAWLWHRRHNHDTPHADNPVLLLDPAGVKFFKFVLVSTGCLLLVHFYVRIVGDKRDDTYGLYEMALFDSNLIVLDLMVFFVVGRLYEQEAVDTLEFVLPTLWSALTQSYLATHVRSLQHSVTRADMACGWTWQMWTLATLGVLPLLLILGGAHVLASIQRGIAMRKGIEALATIAVFLLPYVFSGSAFFHLHHWYYGWLVAMHCNIDVWWSRLARSVFFGLYINGVAIFGRDPIMTCAVTLYQSQNQACPYIEAYENYTLTQLAHDSGLDTVVEGGCNATA
jgi:hypothetical protein